MAASSSSTAHSTNNQRYAVFINHRGVDVKKTFARSLYLRLREKGLTAFLDDEEMQQGYNISSQLEHAIRTASVHVAVFSPRYAESYWCLHELVMMLESKAPIIPVFYGVTPADVRWTQGKKYAQGLQILAEKTDEGKLRYDSKIIKNWRSMQGNKYAQGLQILAEKTDEGKLRYESKMIESWRNALSKVADNSGFELAACKGEELELLDKLVKRLSEMLEKPKLDVARYPTGLDEKLKHFEDTVLMQQYQIGKPQILGIWGLGGVGKTTMAKEFFNRKKSAYSKSCFLFDVRENAAKGSLQSLQRKLLKDITGLDKTIDNVSEGTGMLKKHIEDLKSSNEVKGMSIVSNVLVILDDVDNLNQVYALLPVDLPSGSLVLITSRDKHVLLTSKVENSSIYMLIGLNNQHSRELFCSYAFSQTYPLPGFESLVDEFLEACNGLPLSLKVFGANLYERDIPFWEDELGSFPTEIGERLRISYDALNKEEKEIFLDIACFFIGEDRDTSISTWEASDWKAKRGFQILQDKCLVEVDEWNLIRMHDHLRDLGKEIAEVSSPRRLWRWTRNAIDNLLPSVIPVRGIKMDLSEYNDEDNVLGAICTRTLQILDSEDRLLERILSRVESPNILWLRWRNCPYSSLPSLLPVKNLRYLEVSGNILNTLWQSEVGSQLPLQLPVYLEEFCAHGCVKLKSIRGLAQCTKLRQLNVTGCSELEDLPSMEALVSLEGLNVYGCVKLKSIRALAQCTTLRFLDVRGCSELEDLPSMEALVSLEGLWVDGCVKLKSIRGLAQCTKLRILDAKKCVKLKSIPGLAQCTKLRELDVKGCSELEDLPSMEALVSLEGLWVNGCVKLKSIRGLAQCTKLRELDVRECSELEDLPSMESLVSLEGLWVNGCVKLKSIRGLAQCTKLRELHVRGCSELEDLPSMEALVSLQGLWVDGCVKLKRIRGLAQSTELRTLRLRLCSELEEVEGVEDMSVEMLDVRGCPNLRCAVWE